MRSRWDKSRKAVKEEKIATGGSSNLLSVFGGRVRSFEVAGSTESVCDVNSGYETMDRERSRALSKRDAVSYSSLCDELGVEPEAKDLYDIGLAELIFRRSKYDIAGVQGERNTKSKERKSIVNPQTYLQFVEEHRKRDISGDPFTDEDGKRALLLKYFEHRFGENGSQSLERYDRAGQVGAIYQRVLAQAMKFVSSDHR